MLLEVDRGYLYELARERSVRGRTKLADAISEIFRERGAALSDRERSHVFGILQSVIGDVERQMRQRLSIQLASAGDAPHDLIDFLANDDIEVAFPVLTSSPVLTDQDLISVVWNRTLEHQLAVATRPGITQDVSQSLVETGDERVICRLLENADAALSRATKAYIVEQSRRVDSFQEPLLRRADLDPDLARRMVHWVSASLREYIIEHFPDTPERTGALLEQVAVAELEAFDHEQNEPRRSAELADLLNRRGEATPELLYLCLRDGEVSLFLSLLAHMSGLTESLASRIAFDPSPEALSVLCKAIGVGKSYFASILALSRRARPGEVPNARQMVRRAIGLHDTIAADVARRMVERWRFFDDFPKAVSDSDVKVPFHE